MESFIKKILIILLAIILFFVILYIIVIKIIPSQFDSKYQSVINLKYKQLKDIDTRKIVYVSGSSGAFCIDSEKISRELGIPFVNLGTHAGFGMSFLNELSLSNINKNDIVILAHEIELYQDEYGTNGNISLIATGMNDNFEMIKYLNTKEKIEFIYYLPSYMFQKIDLYLNKAKRDTGVYSSESFNDKGTMVYLPDKVKEDEALNNRKYEKKDVITKSTKNNLLRYISKVKDRGANIVISYPYYYENFIEIDDAVAIQNTINNSLKLQALIDINEARSQKNYFYDTIYHCNKSGQEKFTNLLINKLNVYLEQNN